MVKPAPVVEAMNLLGYPDRLALGIGLLELVCVAIYLVPRTSVLGAILLTGFLGGAVATHVRIGSELFSVVFPIILGVSCWGGLMLRDEVSVHAHLAARVASACSVQDLGEKWRIIALGAANQPARRNRARSSGRLARP